MNFGKIPTKTQQKSFSDDYNKDIMLQNSIVFQDSFSKLKWMSNTDQPIFAGACWDKTVRIFQVTQNLNSSVISQKASVILPQPATCLAWNHDNSVIYAGCIDGVIRQINTFDMSSNDFGKHSKGISSLNYVPNHNVLISTSYENKISYWQNAQNPVVSIPVQNKVFCSDYSNNLLVAAIANQKIVFLDMMMAANCQYKMNDSTELGKGSPLQAICLDSKAQQIGVSSVDGRSNISSLSQNKQFKTHSLITFKSNKIQQKGTSILYPTNACSFNPFLKNWFLTAGSDGNMTFWDYKARNRIKSFNFNAPVCDVSISSTGNLVAYSLGNDWHIGAQGIGKWPNLIGVHLINNDQTKYMEPKK